MKKILLSLVLLVFTLSLNGCLKQNTITSNNQRPSPRIITPIPVATPTRTITIAPSSEGEYHQLKTIQGSILSIQERSNGFVFPQYRNKIVLLQVFGEDCPSCLKEIPIINSLRKRYVNNLQVIALHAQDKMSQQTALNVIQRYNMNYPVIDKDEAIIVLRFLQNKYEWSGILPYMLLIKNGVTEYSFSGEISQQELDEAIRSLI